MHFQRVKVGTGNNPGEETKTVELLFLRKDVIVIDSQEGYLKVGVDFKRRNNNG